MPAVWVPPETSVVEAVRLMARMYISSVLVMRGGELLGIFTDVDLRRLVADGVDLTRPIIEVAARPVLTIDVDAPCTEALSIMAVQGIKHLAVTSGGKVVGVVTARDLAYRLGTSQLYYFNRLATARTLEQLSAEFAQATSHFRNRARRFRDPLEVPDPANLLATYSVVLDGAVIGAANLIGGLPKGCGYALTGSSGRLEQFLVTDRDTLAVGDEECLRKAARIEELLDAAGVPRCPQGYDSRRFQISLREVDEVAREWARDVERHVVEVSLTMDARPLAKSGHEGAEAIYRAKLALVERLRGSTAYLRASLMYKPALGAFGRVPKRFNFKARALAPIEYPVRALATVHGLATPTSTLGRIRALRDMGAIPPDLARELESAWQFLLRIKVWLHALGTSELDVTQLTSPERAMLRNSLKAAQRLHDYVASHYPL